MSLAGVVGMAGWLAANAESVALTVATLVAMLVARRLVTRWRRDRDPRPPVALAISALLALVTAGGLFGLIAVWGLGAELQDAYAGVELRTQLTNIVLSFVLLGAAYALADFVGHLIKDVATDSRTLGVHEREILHRVSQITIYTFAILIVIGLFTDNIGGLLVGAGFLGIVVGMAARQTLAAVLSGFVLMFSKPFEVGDWIVVGEDEGIVTEITIVNTRLRTFDDEYVVLPNDVVSATSIVNRTKRGRLRLEVEVDVDYEADPEFACEVASEAVDDLDRLLEAPAPRVVAKRFGESSVVLGVRGWIDQPSARKRWQARTDIIGAVRSAFADAEIKIPFPQRELSGRAETGGFRVVESAGPGTDDGRSTGGGPADDADDDSGADDDGGADSWDDEDPDR